MFGQLGLQLISDMSVRICSEASIAENPLLAAVFYENCFDQILVKETEKLFLLLQSEFPSKIISQERQTDDREIKCDLVFKN